MTEIQTRVNQNPKILIGTEVNPSFICGRSILHLKLAWHIAIELKVRNLSFKVKC